MNIYRNGKLVESGATINEFNYQLLHDCQLLHDLNMSVKIKVDTAHSVVVTSDYKDILYELREPTNSSTLTPEPTHA